MRLLVWMVWTGILGFAMSTGDHAHAGQPGSSRPSAETHGTAAKLPSGFRAQELVMPDGSPRRYALFVPPQYAMDETHRWPVILFLHGSGECGSDGVRQTTIGLGARIKARHTRFPFIAVFPQAHTKWFKGADAAAVWLILEAAHREYRTDRDRVYLTGLSMGGFAVWEMAAVRPDVFAAIVPICGIGHPDLVANIRHLPVWAFHGEADRNVPVSGSREPIAELRRLGADPKYTEYPGVGHNSWNLAYADERLWRWLLQHRRPEPPRTIDYRLLGKAAKVWWLTAEAEDGAEAPHIRAHIGEDRHIEIESSGVIAWTISPGTDLLPIHSDIVVNWNGKPAYKGEFKGTVGVRPDSRRRQAGE